MAVVHLADAGDDRGEGAHDRHELGQGDGLAPVALEEVRGAIDMLLLEETGVRPVEDRRSRLATDEVAGLVAGDGGKPHEGRRRPDVYADVTGAHEHPQGEEQGVARQEEADE